jgi:hypothetical protein
MSMQNRHRIGIQKPGRYAAVALSSVLALALVGCGDDGGGDPPDAREFDAADGIDAGDGIDATPGTGIDAGDGIDATPGTGIDAAPGAGFGYDIFLRGSFNTFDTSAPFTDNGDGTYTATVNLPMGNHQFKVTDEVPTDERTWSLAADTQVAIQLDTPTVLVPAPGVGNNATFRVMNGDEGDYTFDVDATDPAAPTLTVTQVVAFW